MIDKYPEGAYQTVRGYEGGTSKSCPGLFDGDTIVLAQSTVDEDTNLVDSAASARRSNPQEGTFLHETGHALDACSTLFLHQRIPPQLLPRHRPRARQHCT